MGVSKKQELVTIAVTDDDLATCELVSRHLNTLDGCKVLIQAANGRELLEKLGSNPDIKIIILDIMMDVMDGYETAKIIQIKYPEMRILFYTICKTDLALARMGACGGHGLIKKGEGIAQFAQAIKSVLDGYYFFPDVREKIIANGNIFLISKSSKLASLTSLQLEILKLIGSEKTYKEIASLVRLETRQFEYQRESLFKIFNAKSRVGLAITVYQSGLFPWEKTI